MQLDFKPNHQNLTLGVEMEVQLLDQDTLRLAPKAPDILKEIKHDKLTKEMFRSTLEIITGVCHNVQEVEIDLRQTFHEVQAACAKRGLHLAGTGTHPLADYNNRMLSNSPRYHELLDRNQWLIRRMAVYGLHVHIGMHDGDECIRFNNFFLHFIPHLIALSASSPFWKGKDTGLAASRPTTYEAHPTSGLPVIVNSWQEFNDLYTKLIDTGSIQSMKDIWWDLRPSPTYGTLEIRICDGPASFQELLSLVAWIHLLAHWYNDHAATFAEKNNPRPLDWILRENKWRAIRYGTAAEIISHETLTSISLAENIYYWLDKFEPYAEKLGYQSYLSTIRDIVSKGNSAQRQRKIFEATHDLMDVVRHNIRECESEKPIWT
jgi:carboxylate-amine ligase